MIDHQQKHSIHIAIQSRFRLHESSIKVIRQDATNQGQEPGLAISAITACAVHKLIHGAQALQQRLRHIVYQIRLHAVFSHLHIDIKH